MTHIVICCATDRGFTFLKHVVEKLPDAKITVFSFRENAEEPPFFCNMANWCQNRNIQCFEQKKIEKKEEFWAKNDVDILFAVGWRYMIPKSTYEKAKLGAYVFHDSLLPKYRGFAPTVRAMINGEYEIGATLIKMEEEVDSGDMLAQHEICVNHNKDTIADVMPKITDLYLDMFDETIDEIISNKIELKKQYGDWLSKDDDITYSPKMMPEDYEINWNQPTEQILRFIRATTKPYPGAYTTHRLNGNVENEVRVWKAREIHKKYVKQIPGRVVEIIDGKYVVMTRNGLISLDEISDLNGISLMNKTLGK